MEALTSDIVEEYARNGKLYELLKMIPKENWNWKSKRIMVNCGWSFIHFAVYYNGNTDAVKALIENNNFNEYTDYGSSPIKLMCDYTVMKYPIIYLKLLCAAGADMTSSGFSNYSPIDHAIMQHKRLYAKVLIAYGVRLSSVQDQNRITQELIDFEKGVIKCRSATIAMIRVKRAGHLHKWDKYLLKHLADYIWATRCHEEWQKSN
jgi:hypothetical protein